MKLLCLLLLCLVAAGPAAAIAASTGSVAASVTVSPALQYVTVKPVKTTTTTAWNAVVNFDSVPEGALITIDGYGLLKNTPNTWSLTPGSHEIVLSLEGYPDYRTTVTLAPNSVTNINANFLHPLSAGVSSREVLVVTTIPSKVQLTVTHVPVTASTPVPGTICLSGQHCLTPADAALYYKPGWIYSVHEVCGYTGDYTVQKYCTSGTPGLVATCYSGVSCLTLDEAGATFTPPLVVDSVGGACGWGGTEYEPVPKYCVAGKPKGSGLQPGIIQTITVNTMVTRVPVTGQTVAPDGTSEPVGNQQGGIVERLRAPLGEPWDEMPAGQRQGGIVESIVSFFSRLFGMPPDPYKGQST
jgi:hypothetical protein